MPDPAPSPPPSPPTGVDPAAISPGWCRMMAHYNAEMNRRLYGAAARLDDAARHHDRGAFWRSLHGTFAHLLWADRQWMSRFDDWTANTRGIADSSDDPRPFEALAADRARMDADIEAWAARLDPAWLAHDLVWFSGAAGREMRRPRAMLVTHFFNHQTHHRGQAHALLTASGQQTGATDLMLIA